MEIYVKNRAKQASQKLLLTFFLGLLIGLSGGIPLGIFMGGDRAPQQGAAPLAMTTTGEQRPAPAPQPAPEETPAVEAAEEVPAEPVEETAPPAAEAKPVADATPEESSAEAPAEKPEPSLAEVEDVWPARHVFASIKGLSLDKETEEVLGDLKPGGVVLLKDNIKDRAQTAALVKSIKNAVGLGDDISDLPLLAVDQEGGPVNRLGLPDAPGAAELGKKPDLEATRAVGRRYADACAARGIGVMFAPVVDVLLPDHGPAIGKRSFGNDQGIVSALGLAFAEGAMNGGVLPVVKHFPGHGAAAQDSHTELAIIPTQDAGVLARVLFPFLDSATRGIPGIMAGHIAVPALDDEHPDLPASLSPAIVQILLRERWLYDGVVIADDIAMGAVTKSRSVEQAAVEALAAGCDAVVLADPAPAKLRSVCAAIEEAVESGVLSREALSASKRRLEAWQAWLKSPRPLEKPIDSLPARTVAALAKPAAPKPAEPSKPEAPAGTIPPNSRKVQHLIKQGEVLSRIAKKYGVKQSDIIAWNNLPDGNIKWGRTLDIYVPDPNAKPVEETKSAPAEPAEAPKPVEKPKPEPTKAEAPKPAPAEPPEAPKPVEKPKPEPAKAETPKPAPEKPAETPKPAEKPKPEPAKAETPKPAPEKPAETPKPAEKPKPEPAKAEAPKPAPVKPADTPKPEEKPKPEPAKAEAPKPAPEEPAEAPKPEEKPKPEPAKAEAPKPAPARPAETPKPEEKPKPEPAKPAETPKPEAKPKAEPAKDGAAKAVETELYEVKIGDSLGRLAIRFGTTKKALLEMNGIDDPNHIEIGQKLKVPKQKP